VYDFRRPTTLAREHSRALELAFETFARQWGTQLTANIRARSQVTFGEVVMSTYDEYAASLPATTVMALCSVGGSDAKAVIQCPTAAALSWFSHMLGGDGTHNESERALTQLERSLLRKLIGDLIDDLRYSLGLLLPDDIAVDTVHHSSQLAQAAVPAELMIVASFVVRSGDQSAPATIAIPADVILRRLGDANPVTSPLDAATLIAFQVVRAPLDVSLQLPPVAVTPSTILGMSVGDVIPLNYARHKPLDLAVDGRTLARAAVGANGSHMACVVTELQEHVR
jgi:flagellar motor switch protein FliM